MIYYSAKRDRSTGNSVTINNTNTGNGLNVGYINMWGNNPTIGT